MPNVTMLSDVKHAESRKRKLKKKVPCRVSEITIFTGIRNAEWVTCEGGGCKEDS